MNKPSISLIAAIGKNRELGKNNKLLWDIPEDMKFFRETTKGHAIVMGRKTFESIGRPLPNRTNIIITRNPDYKQAGCITTTSIEEALETAKEHESEEIFIIGGAQIYKESIQYADKLHLTIVDDAPEADAFFPEYEKKFTREISRKDSSEGDLKYMFVELGR